LPPPPAPPPARARFRRRERGSHALALTRVWHELPGGRAILAGVSLAVAPGERVALLGRNGAGKSTLLRHAAGLAAPTRGSVEAAGRVALLLQHPGDYFVADRVADELSSDALARAGMAALAHRHPRDCSVGERQRLALAIVCGGTEEPAVLCLDEPTRGMDRAAKNALAAELVRRSERGVAVVVATHDPEFAAAFATRAVLLADGAVIADGSPAELLSGGWYFATETARVLGGHRGVLTPAQAVRELVPELATPEPVRPGGGAA
jgi:energy-coupling factor transport system ATP-binding protein